MLMGSGGTKEKTKTETGGGAATASGGGGDGSTPAHAVSSSALSPPLHMASLSPKTSPVATMNLGALIQKSMVRSNMPVSVKVYYGQGPAVEIRRFIFRPDLTPLQSQRSAPSGLQSTANHHYNAGVPSSSHLSASPLCAYQSLVEKIKTLYNGLNLQDVNLCWKDDDGDYVAFSSDDELKVAIQNTTDNTLRIYIREKEVKPTSRHRRPEYYRKSGEFSSTEPQRGGGGNSARSPPAAYDHQPQYVMMHAAPSTGPMPRRYAHSSQMSDTNCILSPPSDSSDNMPLPAPPSPTLNHNGPVSAQTRPNQQQQQQAGQQPQQVQSPQCCCECGGEGRGVWYKCTCCADYYLCSDCEHAGRHDQHIMVRTTTGHHQHRPPPSGGSGTSGGGSGPLPPPPPIVHVSSAASLANDVGPPPPPPPKPASTGR